ncbi:metal-dependent transcriptional regulator [Actinotalea sp. M2MS4P-6]|uniref:metal-dependent transcriptional regulator n=1 Tax=Actinotalea sp. M2MS4P-6 TaxID=2983762 RepID=UPI0021E4B05A|nr:metal-dependent transcriptional regulator [Actinotalea sp. M2MS4P-6]MCV2395095.1 metal-dependent transcriptional regulator [Actinotalea sp. M2MS4P-6]
MSDLIDTTEMYLRTIYELDEEGIVPLRARIAERLGHSGPTVSQTVARMERDGLVVVSDDRHLELTEHGRALATRVMRKHRLAERLLTDVIGLEWSLVHDEACRWEHVMSERVEQRLVELLDHPDHSPYGNPIPGLAELGEHPAGERFLDGVVAVTDVEPGTRAVVARLGEPVQTEPEMLARFVDTGVLPGVEVEVRPDGPGVTLAVPGADLVLDLPDEIARHVFVRRG